MRLTAAATALFITSILLAQPVPDTLREVVISAARLSGSTTGAPISVTTLSSADLVSQGYADISMAINTVPGVQMQSGALNTNRISIRGIGARTPFGTNRIRAFYGPIPLTSGDGETTIDDLDMESLGSIEVVRGPHASVYGAGLGGAILISPALPPKESSGSISTTHGSYGLRKNSYMASAKNTSARYHYLSADGWRQNNAYQREGFTVTSQLDAGKTGRIILLGNHTSLKAFIPSSLNARDFTNNPRAAAPAWLAAKGYEQYKMTMGGIGYEANFGKFRPSVSLFASAKDAYEPRPFDILDQKSVAWGARVEGISDLMVGKAKLRVAAGAEFFSDKLQQQNFENLYAQNNGNGSLEGAGIYSGEQTRELINGFLQAALNFGRWTTTTGMNLNSTRFEMRDDSRSVHQFPTILSPELAVSYNAGPGMYYVSAGGGFSLPSVQETLDSQRNFDRTLLPEIGTTLEAGAKLRLLKNRLRIEAALYSMTVKNLLVARRIDDDQYVGINAGRTLHRGFEAAVKYDSGKSRQIFASGYLSATAGRFTFTEFIDGENDYSGKRLTGVPNHTLAAGFGIMHTNGIYGSLDWLAKGRLPANDANSVYADQYETVHARIGFKKQIIDRVTMEIATGARNLFNEKYASMVQVNALAAPGQQPRYFYPGNPSELYVNLKITYRQ